MKNDCNHQGHFRIGTLACRTAVFALIFGYISACSNDPPPHIPADSASSQKTVGAASNDNSSRLDDETPIVSGAEPSRENTEDHSHSDIRDEMSVEAALGNEFNDVVEDDLIESDYVYPANQVVLRSNTDGYVEWEAPTEVAYTRADITIAGGNGKRLTKTFEAGENMMLDESLPDGVYHWESVISPEVDDEVRAEMRAVRESGNAAAEQELLLRLRAQGSLPTEAQANANRQSGSFSVVNGVASPVKVDEVKNSPQRED